MIFTKFDLDKDLIITLEEYSDVVRKQPEIMEFLGVVFPPQRQLDTVRVCANLSMAF